MKTGSGPRRAARRRVPGKAAHENPFGKVVGSEGARCRFGKFRTSESPPEKTSGKPRRRIPFGNRRGIMSFLLYDKRASAQARRRRCFTRHTKRFVRRRRGAACPRRTVRSGGAAERGHKVSSNFLETLPVKIPVWKSTVLSSGEIRLFPLYIQFVLLCF